MYLVLGLNVPKVLYVFETIFRRRLNRLPHHFSNFPNFESNALSSALCGVRYKDHLAEIRILTFLFIFIPGFFALFLEVHLYSYTYCFIFLWVSIHLSSHHICSVPKINQFSQVSILVYRPCHKLSNKRRNARILKLKYSKIYVTSLIPPPQAVSHASVQNVLDINMHIVSLWTAMVWACQHSTSNKVSTVNFKILIHWKADRRDWYHPPQYWTCW